MNPTNKELGELKEEIKKAFLEEIKRRAVERLFSDNKDRLERYYATISNNLSQEVSKEFPL